MEDRNSRRKYIESWENLTYLGPCDWLVPCDPVTGCVTHMAEGRIDHGGHEEL